MMAGNGESPPLRETIGMAIRIAGWVIVVSVVLRYGWSALMLMMDSSMTGYIPLMLAEGLVYVVGGLLLVGLGYLLQGRRKTVP
jgi:hypothetical protein